MRIIDKNKDKIITLCKEHKVKKLFVFGSVLTRHFNKNSDIDLIVDFDEIELYEYANNYFNLKLALEKLLNRNIDLLEDKAIKNPFLRSSIDSSKQLVYG